ARSDRRVISCEWFRSLPLLLDSVLRFDGTCAEAAASAKDRRIVGPLLRRGMGARSQPSEFGDLRGGQSWDRGPECEYSAAAELWTALAEARLARKHDRLRSVLDIELREDARDVVADGLRAQAEVRRDLRIVAAPGDQLDQLALAPRQRIKARCHGRRRQE